MVTRLNKGIPRYKQISNYVIYCLLSTVFLSTVYYLLSTYLVYLFTCLLVSRSIMSHSDRNQDCTLYVGNLDEQVTEALLYELFLQVSPVRSVHLPKDRVLRTHQGYGFVELRTPVDVEYAEKAMGGIKLFGRSLKVNKVKRERTTTQSSTNNTNGDTDTGATLFVKNLDEMVDENLLSDIFKQFGPLLRMPTVVRDDEGKSKGHGFVYYKSFKNSDEALTKMNGQFILNKQVSVDYAMKKHNGKLIKHGSKVERLLMEQAEMNNYSV